MKSFHPRAFALAAGLFISVAGTAAAQTRAPVTRGDVTASLGWLAVDAGASGPYDGDEWNSSLFGSVGAGWHWTDHLKTEVDFGGARKTRAYLSSPVSISGVPIYRSIERTSSRRILGVSQQYQFFRNEWFHPHLAAGATLTWEKRTDRVHPVFSYDPVTRSSRQVDAGRLEGPHRELTARPFVAAGFKAYMTRRAFFRSDLRVGFRNGIDETLLRFGFGADF